jgi:hypothetical protein
VNSDFATMPPPGKTRIGYWGNLMASNFVNLDAIIRREDWQALPEAENNIQTSGGLTFKPIEFESTGLAFQLLRKPEFQRETARWEPEKVVDLVKSFLENDLIPAVIIWKNTQSGNLFVIDGAHRLGAIIAWVHNDYGDGPLSRAFFNGIIPPEQQKAADKTRDLMKESVGLYSVIKASGNLPNTVKEGRYARSLLVRNIDVQLIPGGGYEKAQDSFFKINQKAAPITATELQLIKSRDKAFGIATRALVRSGVGHKFWKQFPPSVQSQIESIAAEIYSLIFKPPLTSPISVGLDLPIDGRGYSTEAISLLLNFVNLTIEPPKKRSRKRERSAEKPPEPPDDLDGNATIKILNDVRSITTRMAGKALRSLALHSAIYFYSATGRFQPTAFIAIASLIRELDLEEGKPFVWFTVHRQHFEKFLASHRYLVNQVVIKTGPWKKAMNPCWICLEPSLR